jgi:hypothetical protein
MTRSCRGGHIRSKLSASLRGLEWAAIVARGLLRATFGTSGPLRAEDELWFSVGVEGEAEGVLFVDVTRGEGPPVVRVPLNFSVTGVGSDPIRIGKPWYPVTGVPGAGVRRWVPPDELQKPVYYSPAVLSPCLLLPIGDDAIALTNRFRHLVADVVEIDDRPVIGGGLPDFWQSNLARVIGACLRNPNIRYILAVGAAKNAEQTFDRLRRPSA